MAQADVWMQGRVLIAGDSRVRRLQGVPDPIFSKNADFCFKGGVLIDDLIGLVDENLTEEHAVIILLGFLGDEVQRYTHKVSQDEEVTLIRARQGDSSARVIESVTAAHARWMAEKPGRIILWTLPYYIDYSSYNAAKMGEYNPDNTVEVSWDSAVRFVQYITKLRLQWVTSIPAVPFYPLNQMLFSGHNYGKMFKTFGSASGENFRFPNNLLSDGLHPNAKLAKLMWFGLHQAINRINTHNATILSTDETDKKAGTSAETRKKVIAPGLVDLRSDKKVTKPTNKRSLHRSPFISKSRKLNSSVHSRLNDFREDDMVEEDLEGLEDGLYGNLSWKASDSNLSRASTSKSSLLGTVQKTSPEEPWSWSYHHRVVRETRSKCYTQGIREQAIAESRLSSMIRAHGLRAAGKGLVNSFNQAKLKWSSNAMEKINAPEKKIRLFQKDLTNLLTDDEDDEDKEEDEEDDEDNEDDLDDDC